MTKYRRQVDKYLVNHLEGKADKETWWWNEEVQECIQRTRLAKRKWDIEGTEERRQEYREMQRMAKVAVAKAKRGLR